MTIFPDKGEDVEIAPEPGSSFVVGTKPAIQYSGSAITAFVKGFLLGSGMMAQKVKPAVPMIMVLVPRWAYEKRKKEINQWINEAKNWAHANPGKRAVFKMIEGGMILKVDRTLAATKKPR